jgi:hypothetical protein
MLRGHWTMVKTNILNKVNSEKLTFSPISIQVLIALPDALYQHG